MNAEGLLAHYGRIADAPDAVGRLRRFVLDLAVRGKLVPQDAGDERVPSVLKREHVAFSSHGAFDIPTSWAWVTVGAVAQTRLGKMLDKLKNKGKPRLYLRNLNVRWFDFDLSDLAEMRFEDAELGEFQLQCGDVLICEGGEPGRAAVWDGRRRDVYFQKAIHRVRFAEVVDSSFFVNALRASADDGRLAEYFTGTGIKHFTGAGLNRYLLPLPPLAEQHRIVAKVDELMALCDRLEAARVRREATRDRLAVASLARLNAPDSENSAADARFDLAALPALTTRPDQIKQLRQTILDLATHGKLVAQDPNDEPASELLKRLSEKMARQTNARTTKVRGETKLERQASVSFDEPMGWTLTDLGTVTLKITDGAHKTPTYVEKGIPFISVKDFSAGKLDLSRTRFIPEHEHALLYKRCDPRRGDILLGRIGTLGKAVLVDTDVEFSLFVSVGMIRFDNKVIDPIFFRSLLNSPLVEAEFNRIKIGGGTHTNKLNLGDLKTVAIPLPPLAEQRRIVAKVDALMVLCDQLEASLTAAATTRRRLLDALLAEVLAPAADRLLEAAE